jgi:hypothetical protein
MADQDRRSAGDERHQIVHVPLERGRGRVDWPGPVISPAVVSDDVEVRETPDDAGEAGAAVKGSVDEHDHRRVLTRFRRWMVHDVHWDARVIRVPNSPDGPGRIGSDG